MLTYEIACARVDKGIAFLDEHVQGWRDDVSTEILDIACGASCILGQIGTKRMHLSEFAICPYTTVRNRLLIDSGEAEDLGFYATPCTPDAELLTQVWKEKLLALKEADTITELSPEFACVQ
jgi:hypothetical protein